MATQQNTFAMLRKADRAAPDNNAQERIGSWIFECHASTAVRVLTRAEFDQLYLEPALERWEFEAEREPETSVESSALESSASGGMQSCLRLVVCLCRRAKAESSAMHADRCCSKPGTPWSRDLEPGSRPVRLIVPTAAKSQTSPGACDLRGSPEAFRSCCRRSSSQSLLRPAVGTRQMYPITRTHSGALR